MSWASSNQTTVLKAKVEVCQREGILFPDSNVEILPSFVAFRRKTPASMLG